MSQAREHGSEHWRKRTFKNRSIGSGSAGRKRAAHLAFGTPVLPLLIVGAIVLVDLAGGAGMVWLPLLAAGPALAATTSRPYGVFYVGLLAAALSVMLGIRDGVPGDELAAVVSGLAAVTLASALASALRWRRGGSSPLSARSPRPPSTRSSHPYRRASDRSRWPSATAPPRRRHGSAGISTRWCPRPTGSE